MQSPVSLKIIVRTLVTLGKSRVLNSAFTFTLCLKFEKHSNTDDNRVFVMFFRAMWLRYIDNGLHCVSMRLCTVSSLLRVKARLFTRLFNICLLWIGCSVIYFITAKKVLWQPNAPVLPPLRQSPDAFFQRGHVNLILWPSGRYTVTCMQKPSAQHVGMCHWLHTL